MNFRYVVTLAAVALANGACGSGNDVTGYDGGDASGDARDAGHDRHDAGHDSRSDSVGDAGVGSTCDAKELERGCVSGPCTVTGPPSALPTGAMVTVTEMAVPTNLTGDAFGPSLCALTLKGTASASGLTLTLAATMALPAQAALFQYVSPSLSQWVATSGPTASTVEGLVGAPGVYGATVKPGMWSLAGAGGVNVSASGDEGELLRNLSTQRMSAAYFDGTRLYVCNGPRVLIYNHGAAGPTVVPDVVLGQPDVDTLVADTTSSLFGSACSAIWSDGHRLVVAQGSRILVWQSVPTMNQAPADLVLGQPDFSSNMQNTGGVSAASLAYPSAIDSDGTELVVADTYNNRVLSWTTFPTQIDQAADFVVGQADFVSNAPSAGAIAFGYAQGIALSSSGIFVTGYSSPGVVHVPMITENNPPSDFTVVPLGASLVPSHDLLRAGSSAVLTPTGGLAAADLLLGRIAIMKTLPTAPATIDFVLGQPVSNYIVESPLSASVVQTFPNYGTLLGGGQRVLVPDAQRLLVFDDAPSYNFEPASRVIGQPGFTTNGTVDYRGISESTLAGPADVAVAGGILAVADEGNSRVLLFREGDLTANDVAASVVVGQPDGLSFTPNLDQATPSASRMSGPAGVALDGTRLIVADTQNHRVLIWNTVPTTNGSPADIVLGQTDFSGRRPNHGNGDADGDGFSDADAAGFFYPMGVASDGTHLYVADRVNHRVLVWNSFPTSNGQAADAVLGQPTFTSVLANANAGGYATAPEGFNLPTGVTLVGTSLWVADTENNRVVRWDNVTTSPAPGAFIGQPDGTTLNNANYNVIGQPYTGLPLTPGQGTASSSVLRPRGVAVAGDRVYVSETDSNRVHLFDGASLTPVGELGQTEDTSNVPNAGGVSAASLATPRGLVSDGAHLWVTDSANHRVVGYAVTTDPTTGASASLVLGQVTFLTNGFNQSSTAANGVTSQPHGLSAANGRLYVTDTGNHRVLVFPTPLTPGEAPIAVYGQPNGTLALANSGGVASASTLSGPRGIYSDGTHLFIADTGNNRVLIYDLSGATHDAGVVLGQQSFTATTANAGGPGAATMREPNGAYFDGTHLWVADTGNHRVLVWNQLPTSNGKAADLVLGQDTFDAVLSNRGAAAAMATNMSFPAAVQASNGIVYIADSGNNRILSYAMVPTSNGASATGVLGQANMTNRLAATSAVDLTMLAGPVGLTADAENLYVTDRDLSRVVVYRLGALQTGTPGALVLGAAGGLVLASPAGIAVERTSYFSSKVYVGNAGGNDVAVVEGVSRLGTL